MCHRKAYIIFSYSTSTKFYRKSIFILNGVFKMPHSIHTISDWNELLRVLLGDSFDSKCEIEIQGNSLKIHTSYTDVLHRLRTLLTNPSALEDGIEYIAKPIDSDATRDTFKGEIVLPFDRRAVKGRDILDLLFGHEVLPYLMAVSSLDDKSTGFIEYEPAEPLAPFWDNIASLIRNAIESAGISELRRAILEPDYKLKVKESANTSDITRVIGKIVSFEGGKFLFNYGMLVDLISSPDFTVKDEIDSTKYTIEINIQSFINYLVGTFSEGFVLSVKGEKARPICFTPDNAIIPKNCYNLVLDVSKSMDDYLEGYIAGVLNFLDKLKDVGKPDDVVRVTLFSDTLSTSSYKLSDYDDIVRFIKAINASGSTHLFSAADTELKHLISLDKSIVTTMVLFTDGVDNQVFSAEAKEGLSVTCSSIQRLDNPPKVFTIGLGNHDTKTLEYLAKITGSKYLNLHDIEEFRIIEDYLSKMQCARTLMKFIQAHNISVASSFAGTVSSADFELDIREAFLCGDVTYRVEKRELQLEAAEDFAVDLRSIVLEEPGPILPLQQHTTTKVEVECGGEGATSTDPSLTTQVRKPSLVSN